MSFRIEKKIAVNKDKFFFINNFFIKNKFNKIYEDRNIYSCYLDTFDFKMYQNSVEGCVPRKKIRLRSYNKLFEGDIFLEKKISSVEGRYKISEKVKDYQKILDKGYFDHDYGICYPKIIIKYSRSYFQKNDVRITLDKKILFSNYRNNMRSIFFFNYNDYDCAEIKCKSNQDIENLDLNNFLSIRSSKYCLGINNVLKNSDMYTEPY